MDWQKEFEKWFSTTLAEHEERRGGQLEDSDYAHAGFLAGVRIALEAAAKEECEWCRRGECLQWFGKSMRHRGTNGIYYRKCHAQPIHRLLAEMEKEND